MSHQHGLEVVLELLGRGMCRRSNAHLEQALHLVDMLLQSAKVGPEYHTAFLQLLQPCSHCSWASRQFVGLQAICRHQ